MRQEVKQGFNNICQSIADMPQQVHYQYENPGKGMLAGLDEHFQRYGDHGQDPGQHKTQCCLTDYCDS